MALTSPGVEVSVINESFYVPADAGTVPLIVVTSAQDKSNGAGTGTAPGTRTANANTVYLISSQRELTETFGDPKFYTDASGNSLNGYELNEFGLQAAYSFLGIANRAFVLRANVDLSELAGSASAPSSAPTDGTYWLDLATSEFGIFEWSATNQAFTNISPTLITSTADLVGETSTGAPKTNIGNIGDYAINTTHVSNKIYYKNDSNAWVQLGSTAWHTSHATITGTVSSTGNILTNAQSITINGTTVTLSGQTLATLVNSINNASIPGVSAAVDSVTGYLEIYSNGFSRSNGTAIDGKIVLANNSGTILTDAGLTAGTYAGPDFLQSAHTSRPEWKSGDSVPRPNGSVWFKTTTPNSGADIVAKTYSSATASWSIVDAPLYANNHTAIYNSDSVNGGTSISAGTLYTQYNITEQSISANYYDTTPNLGDFQLFRYEGGITTIESNTTNPSFTNNETFTIQESLKGQAALRAAKTVTVVSQDGSTNADADDFVAAISAAGFTNITAEVIRSGAKKGAIRISHRLGGDFRMNDGATAANPLATNGTPLADAGFGSSNAHSYGTYTANSSTLVDNLYDVPQADTDDSTTANEVVASNWKRLSYTASTSAPNNEPTNGTLWYNTNLDADIMVHNGTTWKGYAQVYASTDPNGPQFSATKPTTQSDGTALVANDLWIDTSDLENYPKIYRYDTTLTDGADFALVDNSDQTTEDGIVFADARWHTRADKSADGNTGAGTASSIKDLLSDDHIDPDAPNPALYPKSILLFNTRRSGYNVKEYRNNYITTTAYPGSGSTGKGNIRYSNESVAGYYPDRWVTKSANNANGSGSFGRKAQRKVVIQQLKSEIDTNQAIREDQRGFNVIACPGYPEAMANMVNLNTDRNNTAFVVGDTPMRLAGTSTAISNWANNTAAALDNGDEGMVTRSDYLGVFYPSGKTTDNAGKSIIVPSSHMMLRVLANNDNVAFPWFAPAGTRRGVVDNATAVGYVDSTTGEFQTISVTESIRDTMFEVSVNPITYFAGAGIVNFGNKTKTGTSSALDRINVSRLTVYLRSQLNNIAKPFIFEPNDQLTRNEIRGAIESFLLELVGQRALYDFLVVCDETNNTATRIDRNELYVDIAIEPVKSVEFIYIPLRIKNTGEIANLGS